MEKFNIYTNTKKEFSGGCGDSFMHYIRDNTTLGFITRTEQLGKEWKKMAKLMGLEVVKGKVAKAIYVKAPRKWDHHVKRSTLTLYYRVVRINRYYVYPEGTKVKYGPTNILKVIKDVNKGLRLGYTMIDMLSYVSIFENMDFSRIGSACKTVSRFYTQKELDSLYTSVRSIWLRNWTRNTCTTIGERKEMSIRALRDNSRITTVKTRMKHLKLILKK